MKKFILTTILVISTGMTFGSNTDSKTFITAHTKGTNVIEVIIVGETLKTYKVTRNGIVYEISKDKISISNESKELLNKKDVNVLFATGLRVSKVSKNTSSESQIYDDIVLTNL